MAKTYALSSYTALLYIHTCRTAKAQAPASTTTATITAVATTSTTTSINDTCEGLCYCIIQFARPLRSPSLIRSVRPSLLPRLSCLLPPICLRPPRLLRTGSCRLQRPPLPPAAACGGRRQLLCPRQAAISIRDMDCLRKRETMWTFRSALFKETVNVDMRRDGSLHVTAMLFFCVEDQS